MSIRYSKPLLGARPLPSWVQDASCVGLWLMNENSGNKVYNVVDKSGFTDGTLTGMAFPPTSTSGWTGGKFGSALAFDGSNDNILFSGITKTLLGSIFTLSTWVNLKGAQTTRTILCVAGSTADNTPWISLQRTDATTVKWYLNAGFRITITAIDDVWYHLVLTYDGTTWICYVNGLNAGSYTGAIGALAGEQLYLGIGYGGATSGIMDLLSVYTKPLHAQEISKQYSQPFYMFPKRSPIFYSISAGGGTTYDESLSFGVSSGLSIINNAILVNSVSFDTSGDLVQGNIGTLINNISLESVSDIAQVNIAMLLNNVSLDATSDITVENISVLLNALGLDAISNISIENIATLLNLIGFETIADILFSLGDIYVESLTLDSIGDISQGNILTANNELSLNSNAGMTILNALIAINTVTLGTYGTLTTTNIATLQASLTLTQIATLAAAGVLVDDIEPIRFIAMKAHSLYGIGIKSGSLYKIDISIDKGQ